MPTIYVAEWHDPKKVEARAIEAGWNPASGDGFLDIYNPEEDSDAAERKAFPDLTPAVSFLQEIVAEGRDFWGACYLTQYEIGTPRCRYCTCQGRKRVRSYTVDDTGVVEERGLDDCL